MCNENPMERPSNSTTLTESLDEVLNRENVSRNVAKDASLTHFVISMDINMLPSVNLARDFLRMIALSRSPGPSNGTVYLLPSFQIQSQEELPRRKRDLQGMISVGSAVPLGQRPCKGCSMVPNVDDWVLKEEEYGVDQLKIERRKGSKVVMAPNFITEKENPYFEEELGMGVGRHGDLVPFRICSKEVKFAVANELFLVRTEENKKKRKRARDLGGDLKKSFKGSVDTF